MLFIEQNIKNKKSIIEKVEKIKRNNNKKYHIQEIQYNILYADKFVNKLLRL